ncbi:Protein ANTAGONIST OF LIKE HETEROCHROMATIN PROTEIN 1 [Holothuria leucospilota]|uniref:Protein ANTAGONIST OF LIKE HETEROCHROMATIN PROTEIN 1 n=1 Tax=Holothuria leucospilota TaxID=206669 RepID=A0A9Q1CNK7_HOLLE|nr:Protein ANTAGONIST OF LIKE HETEROCHROMATIN PROTEIN 1 [Holothuria leucospilota]
MNLWQYGTVLFAVLALSIFLIYNNLVYGHLLKQAIDHQRRKRRLAAAYDVAYKRRRVIKSGISSHLLLEMDDFTFKRHLRMDCDQFDSFVQFLQESGVGCRPTDEGGKPLVPLKIRAIIFLWYMANNNSYREISDKFNVTQSSAYRIINEILNSVVQLSSQYIQWPSHHQKLQYANSFKQVCGIDNVIGAIDGCHIRINRPVRHGDNYLNRKGYYSILLQGVCNMQGKFTDIFVGPPGRVHDARLLKHSYLFSKQEEMFEGRWKLLGDSAYISKEFPFIVTPKRDNGMLSAGDVHDNACISRGRVIIENAFGRLKCRFRRIRDIQNTNLSIAVKLIIAACTLHNILTEENTQPSCFEHPYGCPRSNDHNE